MAGGKITNFNNLKKKRHFTNNSPRRWGSQRSRSLWATRPLSTLSRWKLRWLWCSCQSWWCWWWLRWWWWWWWWWCRSSWYTFQDHNHDHNYNHHQDLSPFTTYHVNVSAIPEDRSYRPPAKITVTTQVWSSSSYHHRNHYHRQHCYCLNYSDHLPFSTSSSFPPS